MADTLLIEIVSPERKLVEAQAEEVQIPGRDGYIGVLPGHAPLITELTSGEISYRAEGKVERYAVHWGFAEVLPDKVTVLAEVAEKAGDIDLERARQLHRAAADLMKEHPSGGPDYQRALRGLKQAETRIEVAERYRNTMLNLVP